MWLLAARKAAGETSQEKKNHEQRRHKKRGIKEKPKHQQWEDPPVGLRYLFSMVTTASTLIANLPTSPATKTLKSCQQTWFWTFSGGFH